MDNIEKQKKILNMKSYKDYIQYDKKLYNKYCAKLRNCEKKLYNYDKVNNKSLFYGFGGFCKYATKKENKLLGKLWDKHVEKLSFL